MTHDEKLNSHPPDTTDHEQLDYLHSQLADKLAHLESIGVADTHSDTDRNRAADRVRMAFGITGDVPVIPNPKILTK